MAHFTLRLYFTGLSFVQQTFIAISEEFLGRRDDDDRSGFKIFGDDTDVIQSLDRHVPGLALQNRRPALTPL